MQIAVTEIEKVDTKLVLFKDRTDVKVSVTVIEWHGIIDGKITFKTPLETYSLDVYSIVSILGGPSVQTYTALDRFAEHEVYDARLQEIYDYLVRNIIQGCCCDTPSPSAGSFDEVATYGDLPITGITDVLYYVADEGNFYVWDGAAYFSPDKVITSTASGTDTYTGTGSPTILGWEQNVIYKFRFANANTGASTYNLDAVGAVAITDSTGAALVGGEIPADSIQFLVYDGTKLRLMGGGGSAAVWGGITGTITDQTDLVDAVQNSEWIFGSTTGTNTYLVSLSPALLAYQTGQVFWILFGNANTGAATLNVNSLGAIALRKNVSTALVSGDIPAGSLLPCRYDGTNFQVMLAFAGISWGAITGTITSQADLVSAVQNSSWVVGATAGTNTYTLSLSPALTAYQTRQVFWVSFGNTNTAASTININGLGAKSLVKGVSTALAAGDIQSGGIYPIVYDGTNFQIDVNYTGIPTLQQVILAGATMTQLNNIDGAGFRINWNNFTRFVVTTIERVSLSANDGAGNVSDLQVSPTTIGGTVTDGVISSTVTQTKTKLVFDDLALDEHQASDVASAATTDLGAVVGNSVTITGTATITSFGTVQAGTRRMVKFAGSLTLTNNANIKLQTSANIQTAADDTCIAISEGGGVWNVFDYNRKTGNPLNYQENIDWTTGAAVVGFAGGMTTNLVYYTRVGKLVTCHVYFNGTSNATTLTFTLPFAAFAEQFFMNFVVSNNGVASNNPGRLQLTAGSTTATATRDRSGTAWTNSGAKVFIGSFTYLMQ